MIFNIKYYFKVISVLVLSFSLDSTILACDCHHSLIDLPIKEMGWTDSETNGISSIASDIIFVGTVLEVICQKDDTQCEVIFKLKTSYKGEIRDTIKVRTNRGHDACGFSAPLHSDCLIFGLKRDDGIYETFSSNCCKSVSKAFNPKRYLKYITFLESMTNMIDGEYVFFQSNWDSRPSDTLENCEALRYSIKKGKLEGLWQVTDRKGTVLEKGFYKNGLKHGIWQVDSYTHSNDFENAYQIIKEKVKYSAGLPMKNHTRITDKQFSWETLSYYTVRKVRIKKRYKYPKILRKSIRYWD